MSWSKNESVPAWATAEKGVSSLLGGFIRPAFIQLSSLPTICLSFRQTFAPSDLRKAAECMPCAVSQSVTGFFGLLCSKFPGGQSEWSSPLWYHTCGSEEVTRILWGSTWLALTGYDVSNFHSDKRHTARVDLDLRL